MQNLIHTADMLKVFPKLALKLCLVTNRNNVSLDEYLKFIKVCAAAGITALQLREKNASYESLLNFGSKVKEILAHFHIPLIINDNLKLAIELDADGVHLGQTDGDPKAARKVLGPNKIIGVSIDSRDNLLTANNLPIDYVGIGAIFPTSNKKDVATIWKIEGLRKISSFSKHPIIAIGGINESNAPDVIAAGADGIAVIGALHEARDPALTVKNLRNIVDTKGKI